MSSGAELRVSRAPGAGPGIGPPDLTQSRLTIEQWDSARGDALSLAWSCIGGDASVWSADATELAQGKLAEIASSTAERMRGSPTPMHVTLAVEGGRDRTLEADDSEVHAMARTFVAFTEGRAHGCFVTCVAHDAAGDCASVTAQSTLVGPVREPPGPGILLGSLGLAVHHPHEAAAGFGVLLALCAGLAIATRPKTRFPH